MKHLDFCYCSPWWIQLCRLDSFRGATKKVWNCLCYKCSQILPHTVSVSNRNWKRQFVLVWMVPVKNINKSVQVSFLRKSTVKFSFTGGKKNEALNGDKLTLCFTLKNIFLCVSKCVSVCECVSKWKTNEGELQHHGSWTPHACVTILAPSTLRVTFAVHEIRGT